MQEKADPLPALPAIGHRDLVHRLNNLLTVILAHSESALSSDDPADLRSALEVIAKATTNMAAVVHDFAKANSAAGTANRQ